MSGEKSKWEKWLFWAKEPNSYEMSEEDQFLQELDKAHQDWMLAHQRLDMLSSPELIDHAIYVLEAAEKKFSFYLRKAREKGIRIDIPYEKAI
jgi:hypothetical protein